MRSVHTTARLPQSGNAALAAGALIQAALGLEFVFAGLNKTVNPNYLDQFSGFVQNSPAATSGPLAPLLQALVLPNLELAATLARLTELVAGAVLLVTAFEVLRRRFAAPFGAEHGYEPVVALASSLAAFAVGTMSLVIYLLEGGRLPTVNANFSLSSPIAIELLIVPFALGIAWLEFARFRALRSVRV